MGNSDKALKEPLVDIEKGKASADDDDEVKVCVALCVLFNCVRVFVFLCLSVCLIMCFCVCLILSVYLCLFILSMYVPVS